MELLILAGFCADMAVGDPRWLYHPVRVIGNFALALEQPVRKMIRSEFMAGFIVAAVVIILSGAVTWLALAGAEYLHWAVYVILSVLVIYSTVAARDLVSHSNAVYTELARGDIVAARKKVGMIVGRDTENLDEMQIARAAVESVAESTVDGVTAPLFWAIVAGPVGAVVYKAINTLDSTFGYKNERYARFGTVSARIDDAANFIPARITGPVMCFAARILRMEAVGAFKTMLRDGKNHTSPNSGLVEAAMAGALDVQLGGVNYYLGQPCEKPTIGRAGQVIGKGHIKKANVLMLVTSVIFLVLGIGVRFGILYAWRILK